MRRQSHTGIHDVHDPAASSQQFSADWAQQDMKLPTSMSNKQIDSTPLEFKATKGIEPMRYSPSERKLRATAFVARVHSLKYYIGLIGAKSII